MPVSVVDDYLPDAARGGSCYVCGAGRRDVRDDGQLRKERVVDLHQRIDFEGHLMVCETCVREAAGLLGMVDPTATVAAVAALDQVRAERDELRNEVAEAHQLIALIRRYDDAQPAAALVTVGVPEPAPVAGHSTGGNIAMTVGGNTAPIPPKSARTRKPEGDVA